MKGNNNMNKYEVYEEKSDGCYPLFDGDVRQCKGFIAERYNKISMINAHTGNNFTTKLFIGKYNKNIDLAGNCRGFLEVKSLNK
jgi:hypothetical protein